MSDDSEQQVVSKFYSDELDELYASLLDEEADVEAVMDLMLTDAEYAAYLAADSVERYDPSESMAHRMSDIERIEQHGWVRVDLGKRKFMYMSPRGGVETSLKRALRRISKDKEAEIATDSKEILAAFGAACGETE